MKVVAVGPGQTLELRERDDPELGEGQVIVDVAACGICGSDLHMLPSGVLPEGAVLGHELAGTVSAVGAGVEGYVEGDRVCVYPFAPVDRLDVPLAMASGLGLGTNDGGYAERLACDAAMLWRLPDELELEHGALVEPLAVGLHGIDVSGARPEQPLCVLGCGPIGAMTIVGLRARGFADFVVVEPNPGRRELASRLGAPRSCGLDDVHEEVLGALGGRAPEVVIECAGHVDAPGLAVELIAPEGMIVLVGMLEEPVAISQLNVMLKETVLRGSFAYRPGDFDEAIAILAAGDAPVEELVTSRQPLAAAADCFTELRRPGTGELKILLIPGGA
jgi:(R,R)-butanediol dehydrogenase/meso-butanediol dehydrogenase/diacetyl reductase